MSIYKNLDGTAARTPSRAVGRAGVLSRVQPRERRPRRANPICSRDCDDTDEGRRDAQRPHGSARHDRRRVPRGRPPPRGPDRRLAGDDARRSGDARRIAGRRPAGARRRRAGSRTRAPTRARCSTKRRNCCFATRSSTAIRASSATSRRARRRSARSAICWPRPSTPNVGAWRLSPMATEIEAQTIRWIAELIGFPADAGGLLVSGGNMANFVCFLAARAAKAAGRADRRRCAAEAPLRVYASTETHTWIQKAADLFGLGTDAIRWIPADARTADGRRRARAADRRRPDERRRAVPGRRHGRHGQHGRRRSAGGDRRVSAGATTSGSTSTARTARSPRACPERRTSLRAIERRRFGRRRSAQVALCAARSRLRAGAAARAICCARSPTIRATTTSITR